MRYQTTVHTVLRIIGWIIIGLFGVQNVWADNISETYKYAWNENAGWHNWRSSNGQATVEATYLSGYVWAENVGWIKLGADGGGTYANTNQTNWGVNLDSATGLLSGYAWSENAGWVNFNSTHGGVTMDTSTSKFDGYAWGERIGWIHFQNASPQYYVMRELTASTVTTQAVTGIGTTTATGNGDITDLGSPNPTQHGVCWNTTGSPTIDDGKKDNGGASAAGAFTADITGLTAGSTYYVRAFATNAAGTAYGNPVSFKAKGVFTYAVTYNGNGNTGGDSPVDGNAYQEDAVVTVLVSGTLVNTGHAFDNWNTAADGRGTPYAPGAKFNMPSTDVTLYAQWTANPTAPRATVATGVTETGFTANWNSVADATGYRLDVSTKNDFSAYVTGYQDKDVENVTNSAVTGLSETTVYYYRLRAEKDGLTSDNSNKISVTTQTPIPIPTLGEWGLLLLGLLLSATAVWKIRRQRI